jgi:hypothetical protein
LDQNQAQDTSLDSVTAYEAKQQPKSSLKARYEFKTRFKVMNSAKKLKKLNQRTKLDQNQSQNPSLDSGLATNLNNHQ